MLDYCIGTYSSKRPVTLKVAKQAYTKFVGDPKGETSPVIDLNKQTQEFGDKLEELMATMHVWSPNKQPLLPNAKTGSSNKGANKWREILFVSWSFLVHILWVKESEGDNSFTVLRRGNTTETDVLKVPIDSTCRSWVDTLVQWWWSSVCNFKATCRQWVEIQTGDGACRLQWLYCPLGMGNLAASLDPEHKVLRETVLEHFISTEGLDKYVNPEELLDSAIDDKLRPMIKQENLIVTWCKNGCGYR